MLIAGSYLTNGRASYVQPVREQFILPMRPQFNGLHRVLERGPWSAEHAHSTAQMLQFITLISHAGLSPEIFFHHKSLSAFLKQVFESFTVSNACPSIGFPRPRLPQAFLVAITILAGYQNIEASHAKPWMDEDIWAMAVDFGSGDICTSCKCPLFRRSQH